MAGKSAKSKNRGPIEGFNVSGKIVSYHTIDGGDAAAGPASLGMQATGGVISDWTDPGPGNTYRIHTFASSGNLVISSAETTVQNGQELEYLMIAGGGGSGAALYSGGGGAGGFRTNIPGYPLSEVNPITAAQTTYPIVVGGGGARSTLGAASTAFGYSATGGGYGAGPGASSPGGSGGGGGWLGNGVPTTAGTAVPGQGNPGGTGGANADPQTGSGGGGGAGGAGGSSEGYPATPGLYGRSGNGGIGTSINFDGNERWYCGGGGGAGDRSYTFVQGIGGRGGGGDGGFGQLAIPQEGPNPNAAAADGMQSTGGGGGGGQSGTPGSGGSGIIQVRYRISSQNMNPGVKASGGYIHKDVANSKIYHLFTATGTFVANQSITGAEILLIAGGGGGGFHAASYGGSGGGGAGGLLHLASPATIPAATYTITIGGSGSGGASPATQAITGGNSQIQEPIAGLNVIANGGGSGRAQYPPSPDGNGGSGGGGGYDGAPAGGTASQTNGPSPIGTFTGYGNNGGTGDPVVTSPVNFSYSGGGGGGAGAAGNVHTGGHGLQLPGFAQAFLPSAPGYYAGGGGASGSWTYGFDNTGPNGRGGLGGGGAGGDLTGGLMNSPTVSPNAQGFKSNAGRKNTGSGGGAGGASPTQPAGPGGSGVCIISYPSA